MRMKNRIAWLGLLIIGLLPFAIAVAQDAPKRSITQITDSLYRFQNNFHFSVFLVTDEGIIVTDPINADTAQWLKDEIKTRFDKPIRYLIYSHDHADHAAGGEVFADTATVIAHDLAKYHIVAEKRPTAVPDITFSERMTLQLGGKTVELVYLGKNHSDNLIVMNFVDERTLFAVDIIVPNRVPFRDFPNADIDGWIDSLKAIEAMDYDMLAPGHGEMGTKADVAAGREFMQKLREQVLTLMREGKSLEEIKQLVDMSEYKDWGAYENWFPLNVEGMYRHMSNFRRPN